MLQNQICQVGIDTRGKWSPNNLLNRKGHAGIDTKSRLFFENYDFQVVGINTNLRGGGVNFVQKVKSQVFWAMGWYYKC